MSVRKAIIYGFSFLSLAAFQVMPAYANPVGGTVAAGSAGISASGNVEDITQTTDQAVINWQSFNIAPNETTKFIQPSSSSVTLNQIGGNSPSRIFGHLSANGNIALLNSNGVLFRPGSQVNVNSLMTTTSGVSNAALAPGPMMFKQAGNPAATLTTTPGISNAALGPMMFKQAGNHVNHGTITAAQAGLVGLVAPNALNNGTITAKLGTVKLHARDRLTLDFYGDGLLSIGVRHAVQKKLLARRRAISTASGRISLTAAAGEHIVNSLIKVPGQLATPAVAVKNGKIYIYAAPAR